MSVYFAMILAATLIGLQENESPVIPFVADTAAHTVAVTYNTTADFAEDSAEFTVHLGNTVIDDANDIIDYATGEDK